MGAMNKLVVGAITLPAGHGLLEPDPDGCQGPDRGLPPRRAGSRAGIDVTCPMRRPRAQPSPALRACVRQVRADTRRRPRAARTAVPTWEMHVGDMERLRSGKLSPAAATRMWLSMWKQGVPGSSTPTACADAPGAAATTAATVGRPAEPQQAKRRRYCWGLSPRTRAKW